MEVGLHVCRASRGASDGSSDATFSKRLRIHFSVTRVAANECYITVWYSVSWRQVLLIGIRRSSWSDGRRNGREPCLSLSVCSWLSRYRCCSRLPRPRDAGSREHATVERSVGGVRQGAEPASFREVASLEVFFTLTEVVRSRWKSALNVSWGWTDYRSASNGMFRRAPCSDSAETFAELSQNQCKEITNVMLVRGSLLIQSFSRLPRTSRAKCSMHDSSSSV